MQKIKIFVALALACTTTVAFAESSSILGTWEYRQQNTGSPSGVDDEGEIITFEEVGKEIVGTYFGLEREGEHGLYYTAVKVTSLNASSNDNISFVVPYRTYYCERPKSLAEAVTMKTCGMSRYELKYKGRVDQNILTLSCSSDFASCPADTLEFRPVKRKE